MSESRQLCTLQLGEHRFGVEVLRVQEVIGYQTMTRVPLAPGVIKGLINLRGQIVTALDLRRRIGLPDRDADTPPMNVVVQMSGDPVSLLVDAIGDVVEVDDSMFEPVPETLGGVARDLIRGVYKFADHLLLELDVDQAVAVSCRPAADAA